MGLGQLNIIDEYSRESLCIFVARQITADDVIEVLSTLFITVGIPEYLRVPYSMFQKQLSGQPKGVIFTEIDSIDEEFRESSIRRQT